MNSRKPHRFDDVTSLMMWMPMEKGSQLQLSDDYALEFRNGEHLPVFLSGDDLEQYRETDKVSMTPHSILMGALLGYDKMVGVTDEDMEREFLADTLRNLTQQVFKHDDLGLFLLNAAHWLREKVGLPFGIVAMKTAMQLAPFNTSAKTDYLSMCWYQAEDEKDEAARRNYLEEIASVYQNSNLDELPEFFLGRTSFFFCAALGILGRHSLPGDREWYDYAKKYIDNPAALEWLGDYEREGFSMEACRTSATNTEPAEQKSRFDLACVEAFKRGDRVGLPFEGGGSMFQPFSEERFNMALLSDQGSDESSIVDCFLRFTDTYQYSTLNQFVWDWLDFHALNHGTGYGKTYKDHFNLMGYMRKYKEKYPDLESRLSKLKEIATDADSFGNGSLAIVYPAYFYAVSIGQDPYEFVRYVTSFTHANDNTMKAVTLLCSFIENPWLLTEHPVLTPDGLKQLYRSTPHVTAYGTLLTAIYIADTGTEMEVLRRGVETGGDTDSTMATAMLLWALKQGVKEVEQWA